MRGQPLRQAAATLIAALYLDPSALIRRTRSSIVDPWDKDHWPELDSSQQNDFFRRFGVSYASLTEASSTESKPAGQPAFFGDTQQAKAGSKDNLSSLCDKLLKATLEDSELAKTQILSIKENFDGETASTAHRKKQTRRIETCEQRAKHLVRAHSLVTAKLSAAAESAPTQNQPSKPISPK